MLVNWPGASEMALAFSWAGEPASKAIWPRLTEAAGIQDPLLAQTHDYQRAQAYVALGRGDEAVAMLEAREKELPNSYEPPARLASALAKLASHYALPVLAIHAPTLLVTQRVWGRDPWHKLERSCEMALQLGAGTVVVHPPFRWQKEYAAVFADGVEELSGVELAAANAGRLLRQREVLGVAHEVGAREGSKSSSGLSSRRSSASSARTWVP